MGMRRSGFPLLHLATVVLAAALAAPAAAAVHVVTDLGDDGGPGQLRALIDTAGPGDVILIPAGTITLTGAPGNDDNSSGDLDLTKPVTLQGAGPDQTILDGGGLDRVIDIQPLVTGVAIAGLTVRNGREVAPTGGGGGIRNRGILTTLTDVVVSGNSSLGGGGIYHNAPAALTLTHVTVADNRSNGTVGGLAVIGGGAVLTNVTVSGNETAGDGGGIAVVANAQAILTNVTVTANRAVSGFGGGLVLGGGAEALLRNSIVAGNSVGVDGLGTDSPDCFVEPLSTLVSLGSSLVQDPTGCPGLLAGDLTGVSAGLGPLASNGGPTPTHAPLPGSPAIDRGTGFCPPVDQRGIPRPQGRRCDLGAVEAFLPPDSLTLAPPTGVYLADGPLPDLRVILHTPDRSPVGGQALVDDLDVTPSVLPCLVRSPRSPEGLAGRCPGLPRSALGPGVHTISVRVDLSDGTALHQSVTWDLRDTLPLQYPLGPGSGRRPPAGPSPASTP